MSIFLLFVSAVSILDSTEVKQRSDLSQRFHLNSSGVKQSSEGSQRFHLTRSNLNSIEEKQRGELSQRFFFNSNDELYVTNDECYKKVSREEKEKVLSHF